MVRFDYTIYHNPKRPNQYIAREIKNRIKKDAELFPNIADCIAKMKVKNQLT